jgi:predicted amidohydrolase YtcJ
MLQTTIAILLVMNGIATLADPPADPPADLVVRNAHIWTAGAERPHATALAVRGGTFIAVGDERDIAALMDDSTRIVDANGRRVLPGLIDAHVHLSGAASDFRYPSLREAASREGMLRILREHAATLGPDDWVVGVRWTAESWPDQRHPTAGEIDEAVEGRRAVLIRMDGHMILASRAALEQAGITAEGPDDPPGGRIGRLADGTPDGAVYEQAMSLVTRHLPDEDDERNVMERFRRAIRECNRVGLTQVGAIESGETIGRVLVQLDSHGDLSLRIAATVRPRSDRLEHWRRMFDWAAANPEPSPHVRVIGFKGFMDGTLGSRTAWMVEPYLDNEPPGADPKNAGFPLALAASNALKDLIAEGMDLGLQPAVHAIGEMANHVLLKWYAEMPEAQRRTLRPRIEHAQHVLPHDISRFAELGVVASMQPLHKADDGRYAEQRIGPERLRTSYAYRNLIDSGAIVAFGSDWPVVSVNPWLGIHAAVSAKTLDGRTFLPEQSVTVEEALTAYTRGAAAALLSDDRTGMIREGFAADFIIVDRDVLAIDVDEIPKTQVVTTVVGGRIVYDTAR